MKRILPVALLASSCLLSLNTTSIYAKSKPKVIRIISIGGGGMRGLIPIAGIEYLTQKSKKNFNQLFDVAAGSSTGAIIVTALTNAQYKGKAVTPTTLKDLYLSYGKDIFSSSSTGKTTLQKKAASAAGLNAILKTLLGNINLRNAKNNLIIPSYLVKPLQPYVFNSFTASKNNNYLLTDLVMASTSNPNIFPLYDLKTIEGKDMGKTVDPGITFTHQPAYIAYTLAHKKYPHSKFIIAEFGTGHTPALTSKQIKNLDNWTTAKWTKYTSLLIGESISSNALLSNQEQLLQTIANTKNSDIIYYHNFNTEISAKEYNSVFSSNASDLKAYLDSGQKMVDENKKELNKLLKLLLKY